MPLLILCGFQGLYAFKYIRNTWLLMRLESSTLGLRWRNAGYIRPKNKNGVLLDELKPSPQDKNGIGLLVRGLASNRTEFDRSELVAYGFKSTSLFRDRFIRVGPRFFVPDMGWADQFNSVKRTSINHEVYAVEKLVHEAKPCAWLAGSNLTLVQLSRRTRFLCKRFAPHAAYWQIAVWARQVIIWLLTLLGTASMTIALEQSNTTSVDVDVLSNTSSTSEETGYSQVAIDEFGPTVWFQTAATILVLFLSSVVHWKIKPFAYAYQNWLEMWLLFSSAIAVVLAFIYTYPPSRSELVDALLLTTLLGSLFAAAIYLCVHYRDRMKEAGQRLQNTMTHRGLAPWLRRSTSSGSMHDLTEGSTSEAVRLDIVHRGASSTTAAITVVSRRDDGGGACGSNSMRPSSSAMHASSSEMRPSCSLEGLSVEDLGENSMASMASFGAKVGCCGPSAGRHSGRHSGAPTDFACIIPPPPPEEPPPTREDLATEPPAYYLSVASSSSEDIQRTGSVAPAAPNAGAPADAPNADSPRYARRINQYQERMGRARHAAAGGNARAREMLSSAYSTRAAGGRPSIRTASFSRALTARVTSFGRHRRSGNVARGSTDDGVVMTTTEPAATAASAGGEANDPAAVTVALGAAVEPEAVTVTLGGATDDQAEAQEPPHPHCVDAPPRSGFAIRRMVMGSCESIRRAASQARLPTIADDGSGREASEASTASGPSARPVAAQWLHARENSWTHRERNEEAAQAPSAPAPSTPAYPPTQGDRVRARTRRGHSPAAACRSLASAPGAVGGMIARALRSERLPPAPPAPPPPLLHWPIPVVRCRDSRPSRLRPASHSPACGRR